MVVTWWIVAVLHSKCYVTHVLLSASAHYLVAAIIHLELHSFFYKICCKQPPQKCFSEVKV